MVSIERLHEELLKVLCIIDTFCRENGIQYSLFAGTLLGAVRHKGFIPWDDDIDICMSRDQYEKFVKCWNKKHPYGYFLQNSDSDPEWTQAFAKIRKENSAYIEYKFQYNNKHTGLFIDIFPLDRVYTNLKEKKIDEVWWTIYLSFVKKIIRRKLPCRFMYNQVIDSVERAYCHWFRKKLIDRIRKVNLPIAAVVGKKCISKGLYVYSSCILNGFCDIEFEGKTFPAFFNWDIYLRDEYGEYWIIPPKEEQQWKHKPIYISFDQRYGC